MRGFGEPPGTRNVTRSAIRLPERGREGWSLGLLGGRGLGKGWFRGAGGADIAVPAGKFLDASGRVDELLLTGEERMAGGADTDLDIVPGRSRLVGSPAGADDGGFVIFGMKTGFHRAIQDGRKIPPRQIKITRFFEEALIKSHDGRLARGLFFPQRPQCD